MNNQTIVSKLQATNKFSWLDTTNAPVLDLEFYLNHSGDKEVSPIIDKLLEQDKTEDEVLDIITNILVVKFSNKWNRIYETLSTEYDVFSDYKKTKEVNTSVNQDTKTSSETTSSIYGFNSESAIPKDTASGNSDVIQDSTENTANQKEDISGKIGGTSYQDLANKEVNLRLEHNLYNIVFNDISSVMCLSVYC